MDTGGSVLWVGPCTAWVDPAEFTATRDDFCAVDVTAAGKGVRLDVAHDGKMLGCVGCLNPWVYGIYSASR